MPGAGDLGSSRGGRSEATSAYPTVRGTRHVPPVLVYLLLALAWSWPLPLHLATRFTPDPGDPLLVTYLLWWNAHALPLTHGWWNAPFYVPLRDTLALTEHLVGLWPLTTPIQWLGGSPLLAYNVTLIASTWWSGLAAHALARRLTGSMLAAFAGGIAFAYAPYRISTIGHLQLYACWWLPIVLLALHAYYEDGRRRWLVLCAGAWLAQGLTNGYFLLFVPILVACWIAWFTRRATLSRAVRVVAACAVAATLSLPFLLEYRRVFTAAGLTRDTGEMIMFSARPRSFLSATPLLRFWHTPPPLTTEQSLFPGMTVPVLVLLGIAVARRDSRFRFYAAAAVVMAALAFGPADGTTRMAPLWHPYSWLMWLPGFNGLRVPARISMLTVLCLAMAAAIAFARLSERRRWRLPLAIAVFAGLFVDGAVGELPLGRPPGQLDLPEPGARLLALPFNDGGIAVRTMYRSMRSRIPVVNGYAGYIPEHAAVIEAELYREDPTVLAELRRGHALYVLLEPQDDTHDWAGFVGGQPGVTLVGVQNSGPIYRLPALPHAAAPRPAEPVQAAVRREGDWLVADLGRAQPVRAVVLRTGGYVTWLPVSVAVQVSMDAVAWTTVSNDRPGGALVNGALEQPRTVPLRIDLPDADARYVRIDAPLFEPAALTVLTGR